MKAAAYLILSFLYALSFAQDHPKQGALDSLNALLTVGADSSETLFEAGRIMIDVKLDSAESLFLRSLAADPQDILRVNVVSTLGRCYTYQGKYQQADSTLEAAAVLLSKLPYDYDASTTLDNNRGISAFYQSNYADAGAHFERFYTQAKAENNIRDISRCLNNLGLVYRYNGDLETALDWMIKSASLDDSLGNRESLGRSYNNIALINEDLKNYEVAKRYFLRSIAIKEEFGDTRGTFSGYQNLGILLKDLKAYDSSILILNKAMEIGEELKYERGLLMTNAELGVLYNLKEEFETALPYHLKAFEIAQELEDLDGIAATHMNLGDTYRLIGQTQKAKPLILDGLAYAEELNKMEYLEDGYKIASQLFEQLADYRRAFEYHKKFKHVADTMLNESNSKAVAELQTKYETEKKEQQIKLQESQLSEQRAQIDRNRYLTIALISAVLSVIGLWLLNRSRLRKKQQILIQEEKLHIKEAEINASISSQEKERARYARDLHDGFGQMISILNMNLGSLGKDTKPDERQRIYKESEKVINEMYDELKGICFDLMPQTLIKSGLQSGLQEFAERINTSGKVFIETNFFGLDTRLTELQEISIFRVSQEWINNVLKHSDADKITLQVTRDEQEITLLIDDNGSGFSKSSLLHSKGNGWKNLNTRSNLIQGNLELETAVGTKGNSLILNAPATPIMKTEAAELST